MPQPGRYRRGTWSTFGGARRRGAASWLVLLALVALAIWPAWEAAGAQPLAALATPAPGVECSVTPLRRRDLRELANAPVGTARTTQGETAEPPEEVVSASAAGVPVEAEVAQAVEATTRQLAACYNAGDLRRLFALYSDEYLLAVWGGFAGPDLSLEQVDQAIAFISRPVPVPPEQQIQAVSIAEVRQLPAGRVVAVVNLDETRLLLVLVAEDGDYRVESAVDLTGADQTAP